MVEEWDEPTLLLFFVFFTKKNDKQYRSPSQRPKRQGPKFKREMSLQTRKKNIQWQIWQKNREDGEI